MEKMVAYAKVSPKMVKPRGMAGNAEEEVSHMQFVFVGVLVCCFAKHPIH